MYPVLIKCILWGSGNVLILTISRPTDYSADLHSSHSSVSLVVLLSSGLPHPGYHLPAGEHPGHHSHREEQEPPLPHVLLRLQVSGSAVGTHTEEHIM